MAAPDGWPTTDEQLAAVQRELGRRRPRRWQPSSQPLAVGGCFVCFPRRAIGAGAAGDAAWAAAVVLSEHRPAARSVGSGTAGAGYQAGLLALREGALLAAAIRGLASAPDVLLVNATGRDHPRRAGLAVQLGAVLDLPTVGVTDRPLWAAGPWPADRKGATSPLMLAGEVVAHWLRTCAGRRPVVVHAGWRVDAAEAVEVVQRCTGPYRTPAPIREARRLARQARSESDT